MGIDIEAFIEYRETDVIGTDWNCFAEVFLNRDSQIFDAISGVRGSYPCIYKARGLPKDRSCVVSQRYYVLVAQPDEENEFAGGNYIRFEDAEKAVLDGAHYRDAHKEYVSIPDVKSASWLTKSEIIKAIDESKIDVKTMAYSWKALLYTMNHIEKLTNRPVRLVFWFNP